MALLCNNVVVWASSVASGDKGHCKTLSGLQHWRHALLLSTVSMPCTCNIVVPAILLWPIAMHSNAVLLLWVAMLLWPVNEYFSMNIWACPTACTQQTTCDCPKHANYAIIWMNEWWWCFIKSITALMLGHMGAWSTKWMVFYKTNYCSDAGVHGCMVY